MSEDLVTTAVYSSPFEAGMAKSELEAYGIPAFIADEYTVGANPLYSNALGGIKVMVPASRAQEAHDILSATAPPETEETAGEPATNRHRVMAKTFVWIYLLLGALLTAVVIYSCREWLM